MAYGLKRCKSVKVDCVLWTKNGASTLDVVLKRINKVVPSENINHKFIVDDKSVDNTVEIAESNGWDVVPNMGAGISDGANTALKHIETDYFCSFEQDLFLASNWWSRLSKLIEADNVAVVEGIRLADKPAGIRKIEQYVIMRYQKILAHRSMYSKDKVKEAEGYGPTLDNTIYDAQILHYLGGFPKLPNFGSGTDSILAKRVRDKGFKWLADYSVVSTHLRGSFRNELRHCLWCSQTFPIINEQLYSQKITLGYLIPRLALSPFRGLRIAITMKEPSITYVYPLMRFASLQGISKGYKKGFCL